MAQEQTPAEEPARLVVVGASAGGVDALSVLVSTLPADFPAPVVLAQHLDPHRRSGLEQILQRRSPLPIVSVQDGPPTPLRAGTVYVVPANRHVSIIDSQVALEDDHANRPRPSIDLLLTSAAQSYAEHLIAVILTGSESDGAAGAVDVSQSGGTVIIQNPQTAQFPSMPLALPPTAVDYVEDIERIGPLLAELLRGVAVGDVPAASVDPLRDILAQLGQQAHIDFRRYKPTTILRRIGRRMASTHTRTITDYKDYLSTHPEEVAELVMAFLIKVTEFFRDAEAFDFLRTQIMPQIVEHGRANGRTIRIWSAGCATGEEPYSLALLLADLLDGELSEWSVKIFATDLDANAIAFARRGLYPANMLAHLPDDYHARFFESTEHGYRVIKPLRQLVIFGQQDLGRGVPFPRMDLVICRNVLIYFKPELQQSVLELFAYSLHETGGFLFLGQAETVRPSRASFEMLSKKWKVYRCLTGPLPAVLRTSAARTIAQPADRRRQPPAASAPPDVQALLESLPSAAVTQIRRFNEWVLRFLPVGLIAIDSNYQIITANQAARRLLNMRETVGTHDFLHAVRGLPYNQVRAAIDTVFHERTATTLPKIALQPGTGSSGHFVSLTFVPMQIDAHGSDLIMISVSDTTEEIQTRQRLEAVQDEQKQLVEELSEANRRLNDLNKELQDANEELQASNEEMMLTQEELQATNEEFEATNEELQATNEELETSNEEMQATNEELETTNEELAARTNELQELARTLASERRRLNETVEQAPFYILVLRGPSLEVEAFNPRYARLLEGRAIVGRPLEEVAVLLALGDIAGLVREVYRQDSPRSTPRRRVVLPGGDGASAERYFVYTIVPTHDSNDQVDGIVIYAEDVAEQMARQAEERRGQFKLMMEHADQIAIGLYDAATRELLQASPRYLDVLARLYKRPRDKFLGRPWDRFPLLPSGGDGSLFAAVVSRQTATRLSEVNLTPPDDGAESIWDFSLIPIAFGEEERQDQIEFVVISAVELTEKVRERQALERADRLKSEFLALASHELRTPLVPLRGYAEMLTRLINRPARGPEWEGRLRDYTGKFDLQIRYLGRLIDDLVDVGRLQSGKLTLRPVPVDLRTVVAQVAEQCAMLDGAHTCALAPPDPDRPVMVQGDATRLVQVVLNLVENAIKYAPDSPQITLHLAATDTEAILAVHDDGPGIPPNDLPHLFDQFYQATQAPRGPHGGLGLGLFIARQIVEQHGGTLTVESAPGAGTTFTIRLPLLPPE